TRWVRISSTCSANGTTRDGPTTQASPDRAAERQAARLRFAHVLPVAAGPQQPGRCVRQCVTPAREKTRAGERTMSETIKLDELKVDAANLYREEVFSDLRVATIRRLTPIKIDGTNDDSR